MVRLDIDADHVRLTGAGIEVRQPHPGVDERIRDLAWRVGHRPIPEVIHDLGTALGQRFLAGPVGAALAEVISREGRTRLAVACSAPDLADLPWEATVVPGRLRPLALDSVDVWRVVASPAQVERPEGPLRIVAAIGAPEVGGGELLDYEDELSHILDAVDPSRERHALVRVLEWGSLNAIAAALADEPCDVLHVSCHGQPGELVLETDTGEADRVDATRFMGALPSHPTLVVLAGCSTAVAARSDLTGLARGLVAGGTPAVLAMSGTVSDDYATALCAKLYDTLARPGGVDLVAALSDARRALARDGLVPQWVNPVLFLAEGVTPVLSCGPGMKTARPPVIRGGAVRRVGGFVGRRAALRRLTAAAGGILLHGIGGVGKTSLAAELAARSDIPVVALSGKVYVDTVLDAVRAELSRHCADDHPLREALTLLADPRPPWTERLALLDGVAPPILLVLDNAEDNLDTEHRIADPDLAGLLDRWQAYGKLLITSRHPFPVHGVTAHHVGPLSWPETRKLMWRLPAVDALPPDDRWLAWTQLGGHPRALEYLDAVLRGGEARFADVTARLAAARAGRHADTGTGLDGAVAEVGSLIADDVLLPDLLDRVDAVPLARALLVGASVYRRPVIRTGLDWQVAEVTDTAEDAEADLDHPPLTVPAGVEEAIELLGRLGLLVPTEDGYLVHRWTAGALHDLTARDVLVAAHDRAQAFRWWFVRATARQKLADIEQMLESRHHCYAAGDVSNAIEVTRVVSGELLTRGHWAWAEQLCTDALGWIEATERQIAGLTLQLAKIRHARGDTDHAHHLLTESLEVFVGCGDHSNAAATRHQLALIAEHRADLFTAKQLYLETLATYEELGDRRAMGVAHHQLAGLAKTERDTAAAEEHYERALALAEDVDDLEGIAAATHQLGIIAQNRHDLDKAATCFRFSRERFAALGDRVNTGVADIALSDVARLRRDLPAAEAHTRAALREFESLGDRAHIAEGLLQLGYIARDRGDYEWAESCMSSAAVHFEQVGSLGLAVWAYRLTGTLRTMLGRNQDAVHATLRSKQLREHAGMPPGDEGEWLALQCRELGRDVFLATARESVDAAQAANVLDHALWINVRMDAYENQGGSAGDFHRFGMKAAERRDFGEALPFLKQALARYNEIGHLPGVAHTSELLGNALGELGEPSTAKAHFRTALEINQRRNVSENIAVNYHQLGQMSQREGAHEEAADYFRASIDIKQRTGNLPGVVNSLFHLGRVAEDLGDWAEARRCYEECLTLDDRLGDRGGMAVTQAQIGILLRLQERPAEAVPWLVTALKTNLGLRSDNASRNLTELRRNRTTLGEDAFVAVLREHLPADWVTRVLSLTDMVPRAQN
ncbi:Tetratricopeptide repeat-containing protein [Actinokineospora alba]|uniref:Tetratricopeptide repeat-containing protein n=1 Tax=Actinokineospora alba TaxID=504798 RepID=A0A1H0UTW9_9PSEU|nr:tetratricopeptide repeat protein [Actinokineospora alba]TDP69065.1 tetratricopeptide repeat protein [Actinokineospora alba]SDI78694.1 Tetratricopeptide repeat-containing protein [Actinokineospora alba]SDP69630.1 Tetratricopeptide repeat-containing protein [Actinokineospora alba]